MLLFPLEEEEEEEEEEEKKEKLVRSIDNEARRGWGRRERRRIDHQNHHIHTARSHPIAM